MSKQREEIAEGVMGDYSLNYRKKKSTDINDFFKSKEEMENF